MDKNILFSKSYKEMQHFFYYGRFASLKSSVFFNVCTNFLLCNQDLWSFYRLINCSMVRVNDVTMWSQQFDASTHFVKEN